MKMIWKSFSDMGYASLILIDGKIGGVTDDQDNHDDEEKYGKEHNPVNHALLPGEMHKKGSHKRALYRRDGETNHDPKPHRHLQIGRSHGDDCENNERPENLLVNLYVFLNVVRRMISHCPLPLE